MKGSRRADVLRLLGLARRAGAVVPGTVPARRAVLRGEARLILMAGDASSVQLDKIRSALRNRPIPQGTLGDRAMLGAAVGRGRISALAVTSASFADRLLEVLELGGGAESEAAEEEQ